MQSFDKLPKSIKKALRYINQDVKTLNGLEMIEEIINTKIKRRKQQLQRDMNVR